MYKHKHLLITVCIIFIATYVSSQIRGRLALSDDETKYEFYITPNFSQGPPLSTTNSAQISFVAPVGGLTIANFESVTGNWNGLDAAIIESPVENPGFAYVSIPLASPMQSIVYEEGVEILLFTFENAAACLGTIEIVDNETDPFLPPNSQSVNIGNLFTILSFGPRNVYEGTDQCCAPCPGEELEEEEEELEEPEEPTATPPIGQGTLCESTTISNIEIRLNATGTPPYKATWVNTTSGVRDSMDIERIDGSFILLENAPPGIYEILLVDDAGRRLELVEEVEDDRHFFPAPELIVTDINCGGNTGSIEVRFSEDPRGNETIEWSNGTMNTSDLEGIAAGDYQVTVTDGFGCSVISQATIANTGGITATVDQSNITCKGMNDGQLSLNIADPSSYNIQWEGNGISSSDVNLNNLEPGNYTVSISDMTGECTDVQSFLIEEPEEMEITARLLVDSGCEELAENTIIVNRTTSGPSDVRYSLDGGEFTDESRFQVPTGQSYEITAMDEMGCTTNTSIDVPETSGLSVDIPERVILELGEEMELNIQYESNNPVNIQWEDHPTLSCNDCPDPTINPTQTTTYTLILSDDNGCSKDATIIVFIAKTDKIYTPNAFSPNNDGINDYFNIFTGSNVASVNGLQIFNRWGDKVFQADSGFTANNNQAGWDGKFNNQNAEPGVYIYFADITLIDGTSEILQGEINLLR